MSLFEFEHLRPDYLAMNPNGVVPSIKVEGQSIIESSMINEYLDETPSRSVTATGRSGGAREDARMDQVSR